MLVIHDEQLAGHLRRIAERENRPIEDVLKSMIAHYPAEAAESASKAGITDAVQQVRYKAYAKARQYWQTIGDHDKAALTNEELDKAFGAFDEDGIPRLKGELTSAEPPIGSIAYAAKAAESSHLHSGKPDLARSTDDLLDQHFADDFSKRMRDGDAAE